MVLQRFEDSLPWFSEAYTVVFQRLFERALTAHAAILTEIATFLQKAQTLFKI